MNYKRIEVPGQGVIEFPDTMSDEEIEKAIQEQFFSAPQEIITKRDQATVRKAEREIRKRQLAQKAEQLHQQDVQRYLGEQGEENLLLPGTGTFDKARQEMAGQFVNTFGNMLSGVDRLARKVLGDDAVEEIQTNPVWMANPVTGILAGTRAGKWFKDVGKAAQTVSAHQEGNETVAKLAGVTGQVAAYVPLALTGPAAPYLTVGGAASQSFDSTYDQAFESYKRMGFGDDEADRAAFKVSTGAGLITGTVTGLFNRYAGPVLGLGRGVERGLSTSVIAGALSEARRGTFKVMAQNVLREAGGEGTEEATDQLLQAALSYVSYRPELTLQEAMYEVLEAGVLGAYGGTVGGGPFSVREDLKYRKQRADQAHIAEVVGRTKRSRDRIDGKQLETLIEGGVDAEGNKIEANPSLAPLKGEAGRVVVFSHQDIDAEGRPSDEKLGYMKIEEGADIDAAVAHYEMENPNAYFRGAFDLSKRDGSKHFDGGIEETAGDMDPDKMNIEERVETEVQALGDEVFDPVKLGKRRIRKTDLEQLYGGSVSETDQGYSLKLDNGMQLELRFDEKFFTPTTPEEIDAFERSIAASEQSTKTLEEIQAMDPKARQDYRDQFTGAGANMQMVVDGSPVPGQYVQYFSRKADLQTAKHEAIHFLRQSGLITEEEFNTLAQRYAPDAKNEQDKEEAVAYAFEAYHAEAEARRQENRVGVFERIRNFFTKAEVVNEVSGIFNAIEKGEVAKREAPVGPQPVQDFMERPDYSVQESGTLEPVVIPLPEAPDFKVKGSTIPEMAIANSKYMESNKTKKDQREWDKVVSKYKKILAPDRRKLESIPDIEQVKDALNETQAKQVGDEGNLVVDQKLKKGDEVGMRQDINALTNNGVFVNAIHEGKPGSVGKIQGYTNISAVEGDVKVFIKEDKATEIAQGKRPKTWMATINGKYIPTREISLEEIDPEVGSDWTPVGIDPHRHQYAYDMRNPHIPIIGAEKAIQTNGVVWMKNAVTDERGIKYSVQYAAADIPLAKFDLDEGDATATTEAGPFQLMHDDLQEAIENYKDALDEIKRLSLFKRDPDTGKAVPKSVESVSPIAFRNLINELVNAPVGRADRGMFEKMPSKKLLEVADIYLNRLRKRMRKAKGSVADTMQLTEDQKQAKKEFEQMGWEAPRFKEWFGDGTMVDENGNPKVLHHGSETFGRVTNRDLAVAIQEGKADEELKKRFSFKPRISNDVKGIFLSPDKTFSEAFGGPEKQIYSFVTNVKNTFDYKNPDHVEDLIAAVKGREMKRRMENEKKDMPDVYVDAGMQTRTPEGISSLRDQIVEGRWHNIEMYARDIKAAGFDSYLMVEGIYEVATGYDGVTEEPYEVENIAVFDPSNIKILGEMSVGTFDASNYDVRYSVQDSIRGVNVNQGGTTFADAIVDGEKIIETRDSDSLRPVVGERIRIIRTGQPGEPAAYIGEVTVGDPKIYKNEEEFRADQDLHRVPPGNKFDIKEGKMKFGYPLQDPVRYEKEIIAPKLRGRVMTRPERVPVSVPKELQFSVQGNEYYHVAFTKDVGSIKKKGILPSIAVGHTNWVTEDDIRFDDAEKMYTFETYSDALRWAGKMDWEFNKSMGTGKISIIAHEPGSMSWEVDENDPMGQAGAKGRWLKRKGSVSPNEITRSKPVTRDDIKKLVNEESDPAKTNLNFSVQLNESTVYIPTASDPHVLLPHGKVEKALHTLFNRSATPSSAALSKIPGAPKKRKGKNTLDRNVKPTSYAELKGMLEWAIENNAEGDWYDKFGRGFRELVGDANMWEATILFGITSAQNAAEINYADTLTIMALARENDPVNDPAGFEMAVRNAVKPGGHGKLKIAGRQISDVIKFYQTGIKEGGLKTTTYMQMTRDRGFNQFNPFSVQDVHMSRAFGYRYRDVDKDSGQVVDSAKFPSDQALRYGMYMTTKLANEYNMRPDQVQAMIWFYAKSNLSPKKDSGGKKAVGDGTFESAVKYSQPEIQVIEDMKANGKFDSGNSYNSSTLAAVRPSSVAKTKSDPWTNGNAFLEPLLETARKRAANMLVSTLPGVDRQFAFPTGTTYDMMVNHLYDVIEGITDGAGKIKFFERIGAPHEVSPTSGTFDMREPSLEIKFPGMGLSFVDDLAPLMGDAFLQDAVITAQPKFSGVPFGIALSKPDQTPFTDAEIENVYGIVNPEKERYGLNFTMTGSGLDMKFLDGVYFGRQEEGKEYTSTDRDNFIKQLKPVADAAGLDIKSFNQEGTYHDHSGYKEGLRTAWSKVRGSDRSYIQRAAVDELYKPVWTAYQNFFTKNKLQPVGQKPAPHLDVQFSVQQDAPLSPEVEARINSIEGAREIPKDQQPKFEPDMRGKWAAILGKPSAALGYVGSPELLRKKQELILEQAYQAKAVNTMIKDLQDQLFNQAYASVEGWKLPKWMRTGKWYKRLKQFQEDSLPIAAHLNATARDSASGEFTFTDFDMRAGMMPVAQFKKGDHKVGDNIEVANPLTGDIEFLTIGGFINAQGRVGYQLTRKMTADMQQELYNHYRKEYSDMIWLVEMFIDPNLKGMTKAVGGVKVPLFNRFSLESMMKETDKDFEGIAAYTPDVLATRTLSGLVDMVMNPTKVGRIPGRKYKTGKSRESGNVRDLLTGFNIRTFQQLNEQSNKSFAESVFDVGAMSIPDSGIPKGYVKLSTGIDDLLAAVKAYRYFENPQEGEEGYSEAAARLSELDNPENYSKLLGEAYARKGKDYMIREDLVKLLTNKYSHSSQQNRLMRMLNWGIRNSTQAFLIHPYSYVVNMLTNDYFAVEAAFHRGFRGATNILSKKTREMGKEDLDHSARILGGMMIHRMSGIRQLLGFKTQYDRVVDEILPDEVFENSTALADLKVSYDTGWVEYLKQGEIGAAGLQMIGYGNIDLRPKQRLAYAYLKSQAVRRAKRKGLKGKDLKDAVDSYMLNPPKEDRVEAVNQSQFEFLNYADSPQLLQDATKHDVSRLILQYPRFGYHYMHKQADRLKAVKDVFGRNMPAGKRADALAHLVTFATFTGGLGGMALHYALKAVAGDDDDDSAQYIGNYQVKYRDPITGEIKTKKIDYSMITSNRINLSKYFEALGIGDGDGEDFWWRVRNYPMIAMAGAAIQATEDTKKFGIQHGVATYLGMARDLSIDMTTIGSGLKVGSKAMASLKSMDTGQPERPFFDPYGATVPFSFYLTEAAMSSFIPGKRQFDEFSLMIDPVHRRRTASRKIEYQPGPWEAIRQGHAGGTVDRILTALGAADPLPPGGKVEDVSARSSGASTAKSRSVRREARSKLDTSDAGQYYDHHGNLRLGVVPEANVRKQELWQTGAKAAGFNLKSVDRRLYLDQLGPPKRKKKKITVR